MHRRVEFSLNSKSAGGAGLVLRPNSPLSASATTWGRRTAPTAGEAGTRPRKGRFLVLRQHQARNAGGELNVGDWKSEIELAAAFGREIDI